MRMTEKAVVDGREERAYNEDDYPGIVKETTAGRNLNGRSVRERDGESHAASKPLSNGILTCGRKRWLRGTASQMPKI